MYDACSPGNLPAGDLGAVYVDGSCRTIYTAGRRTISSIAQADADEGDVEPGNPGWASWVPWVARQRARGNPYPWLYCCDDDYGSSYFDGWRHVDGVAAFRAAGVPEPLWRVFNFNLSEPPGYAVAVQVAVDIAPGYDVNVLADHIPGLDPDPPPTPPPPAQEDKIMVRFTYGNPPAQFVSDGIHYIWVPNQQGITNYDSLFAAVNKGDVNGLVGMGDPADPKTAAMSGQPWPVQGPAQP